MTVFKEIITIKERLLTAKKEGKKIGFVPTMGALHEGHLSLIDQCKKNNDSTVCSIFVNPEQFNDPKDFKKYPVTTERDIFLLEQRETDILFLPSVNEMYPLDFPNKHFDLGYLENILEGFYRPGHFQGVCKAVARLLDIVNPDELWLGQKDYQQCMVIKKIISDEGKSVHVKIGSTIREANDLAMSSRNMRLNKEEQDIASAIYKALHFIQSNLEKTDVKTVKQKAVAMLIEKGFKIDYIEIADALTLLAVDNWDGKKKLIALAAVFLNDVRLIDNILIN